MPGKVLEARGWGWGGEGTCCGNKMIIRPRDPGSFRYPGLMGNIKNTDRKLGFFISDKKIVSILKILSYENLAGSKL
jgi:hypothetical protein